MLYYVYNNDVGENKDVTQKPMPTSTLNNIKFDGQTDWTSMSDTANYSVDMFRVPFSLRRTNSTGWQWFGWPIHDNPVIEGDARILWVMDIKNTGIALDSSKSGIMGVLSDYPHQDLTNYSAGQSNYTRIYFVADPNASAVGVRLCGITDGGTVSCDIKNARQFDVTNWSLANIAVLAVRPNYDEVYLQIPDPFKTVTPMNEEKFLGMGGIIRNDNVDGYMAVHELGFNHVILS